MKHVESYTKKSLKKIRQGRMTYKKFVRDMKFVEQVDKIVNWAKKNKYSIRFAANRTSSIEFSSSDNEITINSNVSPEKKVYDLLHEIGHARLTQDKKKHVERYKNGYLARLDNENIPGNSFRLDVLTEELDAWHEGLRVAKMLHIQINTERYDSYKYNCIKTYLKWALRLPGWRSLL